MKLKLSPAGLVYIYPIYFSQRLNFNGFIYPCFSVRVNYNELLESMILSTYAYLEYNSVAELIVSKRTFRGKKAYILKKSGFNPNEYGFLTRKIWKIPINKQISVYSSLYEKVKVHDAKRYFVTSVFEYDLAGKGLFYRDSPDLPKCKLIKSFKEQALWLRKLLTSYMEEKDEECKVVVKEVKQVVKNMEKLPAFLR